MLITKYDLTVTLKFLIISSTSRFVIIISTIMKINIILLNLILIA